MHDHTAAVIRLEEAYWAMKLARRRVADEVKADFQRAIRDEIAKRQRDIEIEFAKRLKEESDRGLPGGIIRSEVLRTQDWGRWKKWRDLAEIEPDRVTQRNAKAERELAASPFRWAEDYSTLTVVKDSTGADIEPLVMRIEGLSTSHGSWYVPDGVSEDALVIARRDSGFMKMISDELKKALDNEWISQ